MQATVLHTHRTEKVTHRGQGWAVAGRAGPNARTMAGSLSSTDQLESQVFPNPNLEIKNVLFPQGTRMGCVTASNLGSGTTPKAST